MDEGIGTRFHPRALHTVALRSFLEVGFIRCLTSGSQGFQEPHETEALAFEPPSLIPHSIN